MSAVPKESEELNSSEVTTTEVASHDISDELPNSFH